jgi:sulfite reductase (NADPH) hemoprotein beta-component
MGMSHGEKGTYPRIADVLGFCTPDQVLNVAEAVMTTQRDFGDRTNRKHARLKYTIDTLGLPRFKGEVEKRLGTDLPAPRPFAFESNGDRYGWTEGLKGTWHFTMFIQNGRIRDEAKRPMLTALREIAQVHEGDFRMTGNQNLIIANVQAKAKKRIDDLLRKHGFVGDLEASGLRRSSLACVAFPTCSQAMAESERYLPSLIDKLDTILGGLGLAKEDIIIRMTGCPNGCARPYLAEIALVGKAPGQYNLYLGGGFTGNRLNKLFREGIGEAEIVGALEPLFQRFAEERQPGEHFGDFVIRAGVVKATPSGKEFHDA